MDAINYIFEIRFDSPFFMAAAAAVTLIVLTAWRKRSPISDPYIGFFHTGKKHGPPFSLLYRALLWGMFVAVILAIGQPFHAEYESRSKDVVSVMCICDFSGSLEAVDEEGNYNLILEDSLLNALRLSLIEFVQVRKETHEIFLLPYSDVPYAARYFAGGKEAEIQVGGFLDRLAKEMRREKRMPGSRFYAGGTHTAFALDVGLHYYRSFSQERRDSMFLLVVTDLEDARLSQIARNLDRFVQNGLTGNIYVVVLSGKEEDDNIRSIRNAITYPKQIRFLRAHDKLSLDVAFYAIGEAEQESAEVVHEVFHSRSLRMHFIIAALVCLILFVIVGEFTIRRTP